uniref:Uncharacterized protein n=1 Tax=Utricularia reniformis TaxID=192314 RepID=A0A1Y0AZ97_9LAMI|nr:hypothetical protein AEK19_MT0209 [Utricularia reniformis]ART30487.1 hypothetical protein AEK19_MT0209 [Utricularia reniformis]
MLAQQSASRERGEGGKKLDRKGEGLCNSAKTARSLINYNWTW